MRAWIFFVATAIACQDGGGHTHPADAGAQDARPWQDAAPEDAGRADLGDDSGAPDAGEAFAIRLETEADFLRFQGPKDHLKYLSRVRGAAVRSPIVADCYFQNMALYEWHILFLRSFREFAQFSNEDYASAVLRRATRIWWGGGVQRLARRHPVTGAPDVLAYFVYSEAAGGSELEEADVVEVDQILKSCIPYALTDLAFVPSDPFQADWARRHMAGLAAQGVAVVFP